MSAALGLVPALESEQEERKQSWQDNECLQALAALANTRGGTLWVGVKDNGDPVMPNGWPDADDGGKMEAITNKIVAKLGIHLASVTIETLKEKPVLAIQMHRAPAPVLLSGHYWRRVGNSSREVPAEELTRFLLDRTGAKWDALPCNVKMDALDARTFEEFKALAQNRLPALRPNDDPDTILNNLELRNEEGRLLRAAVLLFGKEKEPQRLSPTAFAQIGRFRSGATILDEKQITGNLFAQLEGVMEQFRKYLHVRYDFPADGDQREGLTALQPVEVWEYPRLALREAVANALLHRDYTDTGRVMIRVYDDRILITSPGTLPEGITVADLSHDPHPSKLRNPLLAQAFYFTEIVERWGSGTTRMAELCTAQNLPAPEFAQVGSEVHVTFRKDPFTDDRLRALGLSERQIQAVRFVREKGSISNAEHRALIGDLPARTSSRDLEELVEAGVFIRPQKGRQARYLLRGKEPAKPAINPP
ncbi:MAG: putative transcriptional regulator [Chthonomonadaceae bacterium]|nr:putative transcriptional regulator [Chthonomonadaceae bacterium]